jgi:hypothetical protein
VPAEDVAGIERYMDRYRGFLALVTLLVCASALAACGGSSRNNGTAVPGASAAAPATRAAVSSPSATVLATVAGTSQAQATAAAQTVHAGDLDLTVVSVTGVNTRAYDRANSADTAVALKVADRVAKSTSFDAIFDVKLIDTNGKEYEPEFFCTGCPDQLDSVDLTQGQVATGTVYFNLKGATPKQLVYQHFSDPAVTIPVTRSGPAATPVATADPKSPDCQYASRLVEAYSPFLVSVFSLLGQALEATPGPGGTPGPLSNDQAKKIIDDLAKSVDLSTTALKKITPPNDFKQYHADVVKAFDTFKQELADAQKAVAKGDVSKANDLLAGSSDLESPMQAVDKKYPELTARLNACPSPPDKPTGGR